MKTPEEDDDLAKERLETGSVTSTASQSSSIWSTTSKMDRAKAFGRGDNFTEEDLWNQIMADVAKTEDEELQALLDVLRALAGTGSKASVECSLFI